MNLRKRINEKLNWLRVKTNNSQEVVLDVLRVLDILETPDKWCRLSMAQDKDGEPLYNPWDKRAEKFCLLGAMYRAECGVASTYYLNLIGRKSGFKDLSSLNDKNNYESIKDFLIEFLWAVGYNKI